VEGAWVLEEGVNFTVRPCILFHIISWSIKNYCRVSVSLLLFFEENSGSILAPAAASGARHALELR
jgi:hypothetical protein